MERGTTGRQRRIHEEASEWLVALKADGLTPKEEREFFAWRRAHPDHERAYQLQLRAWEKLPELARHSDLAKSEVPASWAAWPDRLVAAFIPPHGHWKPALAAAALLLVVGWVVMQSSQEVDPMKPPASAQYTTAVAEIEKVELPDGSNIMLGARSRIQVRFNADRRVVQLEEGEAFFTVARDVTRPFYVLAGHAAVRVVGTQFDMHRGINQVRVSVLQGTVEVLPADADPLETHETDSRLVLTAGQQAISPGSEFDASLIRSIRPEDLGTWRDGRLVYVNAYLRDVVADINRYYDGEVVITTEELGALQLTASFRANQIDEMIRSLELALPLEVEYRDSRHIALKPKAVRGQKNS
jgi:transmembrane sensor